MNNEGQFLKLLKCIGREDILDDPRFKDWPSRIENEPAMRKIIETAFAEADAETWEVRLSKPERLRRGSIRWRMRSRIRSSSIAT